MVMQAWGPSMQNTSLIMLRKPAGPSRSTQSGGAINKLHRGRVFFEARAALGHLRMMEFERCMTVEQGSSRLAGSWQGNRASIPSSA